MTTMRGLDLIPILLLALSSNADNVGVGIAYGIRKITVPRSSNLLIALVTGLATFVSMLLGQTIGLRMHSRVAGIVGGTMIAALGAWVLVQSARSVHDHNSVARGDNEVGAHRWKQLLFALRDPASLDHDGSGHIDEKEVGVLAVALSLNNVANGVAAGMVGMNTSLTTAGVMLFSVMTLSGGVSAGKYGRRMLGNFAGVLSGILLVAVGMYELHA